MYEIVYFFQLIYIKPMSKVFRMQYFLGFMLLAVVNGNPGAQHKMESILSVGFSKSTHDKSGVSNI
jgi:hypothetical protein